MTNKLTIEQGERLNQIFKKHNLRKMSIESVNIWFVNGDIYRDISHLNRSEIFELFHALSYDKLLISNGHSILNVTAIVDSLANAIIVKIGKNTSCLLERKI